MSIRRLGGLMSVAVVLFAACSSPASPGASGGGGGGAAGCTVGVSWNNFQQPR